jgi:folate-binding Fe-S cluster repair protein YgfZ
MIKMVTTTDSESESFFKGPGFIKLDYMTLVKIEDSDAESFLQGQLTNDLNLLEEHCGQINAYCTPKGRALAIFQLFRDKDCFWMLIPHDIADSLLKRLRMYVMRSKVTFTIQDTDTYIGAIGKSPPEICDHPSTFALNDHFQRTLIVNESQAIDTGVFLRSMQKPARFLFPSTLIWILLAGLTFKKAAIPDRKSLQD